MEALCCGNFPKRQLEMGDTRDRTKRSICFLNMDAVAKSCNITSLVWLVSMATIGKYKPLPANENGHSSEPI